MKDTDKINVMDKFGVTQRIVPSKWTLHDLLTLDIFYSKADYYVVDEHDKYFGTLSKELLQEVPLDMLYKNPALEDLCNVLTEKSIYYESSRTDDFDMGMELEQISKMFIDAPCLQELPVINKDKELVAIVDKTRLLSIFYEIQHKPDVPVNEWSFNKFFAKNDKNFNAYAKDIFSQKGEDGILERLFSLIGMKNKYAVEFGGWDGVFLSNIRHFILEHGYAGLFIEGNPEKAAQCKDNYIDNPNVSCVEGFVGFINNKKLDNYLLENAAPDDFDLLVIDIDGYDYHVWDSLIMYQPRVVVIEYNPSIPNDVIFITPFSENHLMASSAAAMVSLAHKKGYELAAVTNYNCIFVKANEYEKLGILDNSLETLRFDDIYNSGKYYQAHNEEIYYIGYPAYLWSKRKFPSQTFTFKNLP